MKGAVLAWAEGLRKRHSIEGRRERRPLKGTGLDLEKSGAQKKASWPHQMGLVLRLNHLKEELKVIRFQYLGWVPAKS